MKKMDKETRKLEGFMAGLFLALHLVMVALMDGSDPWIYDEISILLALACVVLVSRLAWDKFKKTLE